MLWVAKNCIKRNNNTYRFLEYLLTNDGMRVVSCWMMLCRRRRTRANIYLGSFSTLSTCRVLGFVPEAHPTKLSHSGMMPTISYTVSLPLFCIHFINAISHIQNYVLDISYELWLNDTDVMLGKFLVIQQMMLFSNYKYRLHGDYVLILIP